MAFREITLNAISIQYISEDFFSIRILSMVELAGIIILGILAQWIAWRTRVPAILPLILVGLFVGPISTLFSEDGGKWIEPIYDGYHGLFPGQSLFYFVSLSIGIILFEGGLTLKKSEIGGVERAILNLVSIGAVVTFFGAGIAAHFIMHLSWSISFLFAGLIIVTGPTVIAPILRNVPLNRNIATVLKWEGILIDPIGALVAVLVYEFISSGSGGEFTIHALQSFGKILVIGGCIGFASAYLLKSLIDSKSIPPYLLNVFTLALVLGVFVTSDLLAHESGLLSVVVMGMVLGNLEVEEVKEILHFKETISILLISILFILLSANMDIEHLKLLLDWRVDVLFLVIVFILRPLGVFLSTTSSELSFNEKLFISWVGPRGIVAAGIASLFGLRLVNDGVTDAEYITPLVFMVVLGTVLLNATTARLMARLLHVIQDKSNGVLIIGINATSKLIARYLRDNNRHVVLIDNNNSNVKLAQDENLDAVKANIYEDDFRENFELLDMGYLLAMTSSTAVNKYAIEKFKYDFGEEGTYRLLSTDESKKGTALNEGLFSKVDDYIRLSEVVRDYPQIHEMVLDSQEHFITTVNKINESIRTIPLMLKDVQNNITIIPSNVENLKIEKGDTLIYIGKSLA